MRPPPWRHHLVAFVAGLSVFVPTGQARAQARCSGEVVSDTYDASSGVTPDALATNPWIRSGTGTASVANGLLTIDGTTNDLAFLRRENLGGPSPYYRIEATYAVVSSGQGGSAATVATIQDRQIILWTDSAGVVWMSLHTATSQSVVESVEVGQVQGPGLHDYVVDATRDGPVTITVDGQPLAHPLQWGDLPFIPGGGTTGLGPTVSFDFGASLVASEWQRAYFEACRPANVSLGIQTVVPPPGANHVLKGGMGETLDGLTGLTATLDRVDVVEETVPGDPSTAQVITVSNGPQPVTLATTLADTSVRPMTGVQVPPGAVTQVRLVVSDVSIDVRGSTYPVRVPSGAQTGIKIVPDGGELDVPSTGVTSFIVELPIFSALGRNRAASGSTRAHSAEPFPARTPASLPASSRAASSPVRRSATAWAVAQGSPASRSANLGYPGADPSACHRVPATRRTPITTAFSTTATATACPAITRALAAT